MPNVCSMAVFYNQNCTSVVRVHVFLVTEISKTKKRVFAATLAD